MMTVGELIQALEKLDADAAVFVSGHPDGGGYDEIYEPDDSDYIWVKDCGFYCSYAGRFDPAQEADDGAIRGVCLR